MIIDGRAIALEILAETAKRVASLPHIPRLRAVVLRPTPVTESYLRIKSARASEGGMTLEIVRLPDDADEETVLRAASSEEPDATIIQLPLPEAFDKRPVLDAIPLAKDADVLSTLAYERFLNNEQDALLPPVVCAVSEMLARANIIVAGKHTVVVGNGRLVGAPVRAWLAREGADVTMLTQETFNEKKSLLKDAEIVVSGAGSPHFITPDMLKPGAVLVDAGTSESGGAIVGDFHPACADIASVFTPVPGGVGPVAVACLFKNVAELLGR